MLHIFRKYQRGVFIFITAIIIISFSFFGTYSTINELTPHQQVAFTAIDGTQITRGELEEMALFLGTDREDKVAFGGAWGPNFLNDGVIRKNFLQTGMGEILAENYRAEVIEDLASRFEREKNFSTYTHPQAQFLTASSAWSYFAPNINEDLAKLKSLNAPLDENGFGLRANLYLAEKKFPQTALKQVLRFQEKQFRWVPADPELERKDLSLFGYHTLEDWFGPRFIRLVSEFIINAAKIAGQRGYVVTDDEALADLLYNNQTSFQENQKSPYLDVANSDEYFNEQLRRMGLNKAKAVKLWRQVLLFKRMFNEFGNVAMMAPETLEPFLEYSRSFVSGDLYQLPTDLRLASFRSLIRFEAYLAAIAKPGNNPLDLPESFLPVAEIAKNTPELVKQNYQLEVAQADKKSLQTRVGVRDMWKWQIADENWAALKKKFPDLGIAKAKTGEERFAALEGLDEATRNRIDVFSREQIVESHPEWLEQALQQAPRKQMTIGMRAKGGEFPFAGIEDRAEFIALLDQATIASSGDAPNEADKKLMLYTPDQVHYYIITVLKREDKPEVLTYAEAEKDGTLSQLIEKQLQAYYEKIRADNPTAYQAGDKSWRPLADVVEKVANSYYAKLIEAVKKDYEANKQALSDANAPKEFNGDTAAIYRFFAYLRKARSAIEQGNGAKYILAKDQAASLSDQWKLVQTDFQLKRNGQEMDGLDRGATLAMELNTWSPIFAPADGGLSFMHVKDRGIAVDQAAKATMTSQLQTLLTNGAERSLMQSTLGLMQEKGAINLDYLHRSEEPVAME